MSSTVHAWAVFRKTRVVALSLALVLDLFLALLIVVGLVGSWAAYDSSQRGITMFMLIVNLFSVLSCILFFLTRTRLMLDLTCICVLVLIKIGTVVTFTLAAPSFPCAGQGPVLGSCEIQESIILYGSCVSTAVLCLYLMFLVPMLRLPQSQLATTPVTDEKIKISFSDAASELTYYSWDRGDPMKREKYQSKMTAYSQASFSGPYNFTLASKPVARQSSISKRPLQLVRELNTPPSHRAQQPSLSLRPFSPPPMDRPGTSASTDSQSTMVSNGSWKLSEPPKAKLSTVSEFPSAANGRSTSPGGKPKHRPAMLSLDKIRNDTDSITISDVPRSPSPVESYHPRLHYHSSARSGSGTLPRHPQLAQHMATHSPSASIASRV